MIREEYLRRLVDAAYVDIYLSGTDGARLYWPWRMRPVHEATSSYRNACEKFIVDSSFNHPDITNSDVLATAASLDAEAAVLADVWQDVDATVEALVEGIDAAQDHAFDGELILPLQPPHDECFRRLRERGIGTDYVFAVGGVKDASDRAKVQAAMSLSDATTDDIHIHGLGFGITDTITAAIQNSPTLLDSIDYSTPVQTAINNPTTPGDEVMSVIAAQAGAQLIKDLRSVTPYPDAVADDTTRTVLSEF